MNSSSQFCRKRLFAWLLALVVCLAGTVKVLADTNAVIPYEAVDHICEIVSQVDQTKLRVRAFLGSSNPAVYPTNITAIIQSASGMIPVQIGEDGQILNFPHRKALARENPPIITNQPKGTLGLRLSCQLALPDSLSFRYARLGEGVAEANRMIRLQAGTLLSLLAPKAQGVIFFFPKTSAGRAKIEILSATGRKEFTADEQGRIKFKVEKALLSEDPEVRLPEKPKGVRPDLE